MFIKSTVVIFYFPISFEVEKIIHRWFSIGLILGVCFLCPLENGYCEEEALKEPSDSIWGKALNFDPYSNVFHKWDKSVRGFRKGHNFGLLLGYASISFSHESKDLESYNLKTGVIRGRYAYHILTNKNVGYFLGTTAGFFAPRMPEKQNLTFDKYIEFPSLLFGGVFNPTSVFRIDTYLEGYLSRLERFRKNPLVSKINVSGQTIRVGIGMDTFYRLEWAVRLESSFYWSRFKIPFPESSRDHNVNSLIISGWDASLGILLHII